MSRNEDVNEPSFVPVTTPPPPPTSYIHVSEESAREIIWRAKGNGKGHTCIRCGSPSYYTLKSRPEVRECRHCRRQQRVRAGTPFEGSKISLTHWLLALDLYARKRERLRAMELMRRLALTRYETAWLLLAKIQEAAKGRTFDPEAGLDDLVKGFISQS
jgi:hypothetical protein